jgi:hypothetical protein
VLVALEGVGEHLVLLEVLEIVEHLALAARHAGNGVEDQQVRLALGEVLRRPASNTNFSVSPIVSGAL